MKQAEAFFLKQPEVQSMVGVMGFSFSGQGQNAGLAFVTLKDWKERKGEGESADDSCPHPYAQRLRNLADETFRADEARRAAGRGRACHPLAAVG